MAFPAAVNCVVSDEEENSKHKGLSFAECFSRYEKEVSPGCRVTFVSFLADMNAEGQMVAELRALGYGGTVEQFKLHRERPDLTKTDALLAVMSAQTPQVLAERAELEKQLLGCTSIAAVPAQQNRLGARARDGASHVARRMRRGRARLVFPCPGPASRH